MNRGIICIGDYHGDVVVKKKDIPVLDRNTVEKMWNGEPIAGVSYPPGGAGHTVSCAIKRLGGRPIPFGVVGGDHLGAVSTDALQKMGIPTQYLTVDPKKHSITVVCITDENGERTFEYGESMAVSADVTLSWDMVREEMLAQADILYVSGIRLVFAPGAQTSLRLMAACKKRGITVAVDLNMRKDHYAPEGELLERYQQAVALSDIVFGSGDEELCVVTGERTAYAASRKIAAMGKIAVCKMGGDGAAVFTPTESFYHRGFPVKVVDTIGAGDNFVGGFLAEYAKDGDLRRCLLSANAVGAYSVAHMGAGCSPEREALDEILKKGTYPIEEIKR